MLKRRQIGAELDIFGGNYKEIKKLVKTRVHSDSRKNQNQHKCRDWAKGPAQGSFRPVQGKTNALHRGLLDLCRGTHQALCRGKYALHRWDQVVRIVGQNYFAVLELFWKLCQKPCTGGN